MLGGKEEKSQKLHVGFLGLWKPVCLEFYAPLWLCPKTMSPVSFLSLSSGILRYNYRSLSWSCHSTSPWKQSRQQDMPREDKWIHSVEGCRLYGCQTQTAKQHAQEKVTKARQVGRTVSFNICKGEAENSQWPSPLSPLGQLISKYGLARH